MEGQSQDANSIGVAVFSEVHAICTGHSIPHTKSCQIASSASRFVEKLLAKDSATTPNKASDECSPSVDESTSERTAAHNRSIDFIRQLKTLGVDRDSATIDKLREIVDSVVSLWRSTETSHTSATDAILESLFGIKAKREPSGDKSRRKLNSFLKLLLNLPIATPQGERTLWGVITKNRDAAKSHGVFVETVGGRDYLLIQARGATSFFGLTHNITERDIVKVLSNSSPFVGRRKIHVDGVTSTYYYIPVDYILANVELKEVSGTSESAPIRCYDGEPLSEPLKPMNGESSDAMRSIEGIPPVSPHNPPAVATIPVGTKVRLRHHESFGVGTVVKSSSGRHVVQFAGDSAFTAIMRFQDIAAFDLEIVEEKKQAENPVIPREKLVKSLMVASAMPNESVRISKAVVKSLLHHLTH